MLATTICGSVYRINLATMNKLIVAESHTSDVLAVAFSTAIHDKFATVSIDGTVR
jgi:hypothetical protein